MSYSVPLLLALALCFAAQAAALHFSGGRTVKSESNFFSSLGRIQAGARDEPLVMLLGSSISGRLPDRAHGFDGFANMGCDGGSAMDTLRAMDDGILPAAPVLMVEANALQVALNTPETEVERAMRGAWFRVGRKIPALAAYARPAAIAYSPLLAQRTGRYGGVEGEDLGDGSSPVAADPAWAAFPASDREIVVGNELAERMQRLRGRGSRVIVLWLPPARPGDHAPPGWVLRAAAMGGAEWWDLGQGATADSVRLTDGIHMDAASATRTMRSMIRELGE